uniref:Glycosyltransferase n=1 Tax=Aromatoleum buckelii TaxID=200254 RepID=A0ABX1N476_9RHOO
MHASIIIPVKNGGALYRNVLDQVLAQRAPWPFECIVLDSGSWDGSLQYTESKPDVRLKQIRSDEFGHGRTRNLGASMASGKFLVFITHDALPVDDQWLANLVAAAEVSPAVAGVFGRHVAYPAASPVTKRELEEHFSGFGGATSIFRIEDRERYAQDEGLRQFLHFFSNNNACLRRSVWERIPYPDVDFAEDQAWAKQIMEAGYSKAYAPAAAVYHSHDFGIIETARRAYDEARALHRIFGYRQVASPLAGIRSWNYLTRRNMGWSWQSPAPLVERLFFALRAPLHAASKLAGLYLGEREGRLPVLLARVASRDRALRTVQRKVNTLESSE